MSVPPLPVPMIADRSTARRFSGLAAGLAAALLAACGGGGGSSEPQPKACESLPCVVSGFTGDFEWEFRPAEGSDGGIGGGADGGGGAGIGGALGQFRNAEVVVTFQDGTQRSALTDSQLGMVTVRPTPGYTGPLRIEIRGRAGATYFEEGKNATVPFPEGRVLRAVVPRIDRNIGVTPFTEAGAQLALSCQAATGPQEACSTIPPRPGESAGSATVPAPSAIRSANALVTETLNRNLPHALFVDDITRLPYIVGDATPDAAIVNSPRGRYGLANIAFSKQAAMYNSAAEAPTLLGTDQLSRDLSDGRLDGVGGAATEAAQRTYDPHTLTSELSAALAQQTMRYGDAATRGLLPAVTAFGNTRYDSYYFDATLVPDGTSQTIAVATEGSAARRAPGQRTTYVGPGTPDARGFMLYGNMGSGSLFIKTDAADSRGRLLAIGDNVNGELGNGTRQPTTAGQVATPQLPGILTHVAGGFAHTVARLADGSVWAWGDNAYGQLGQGQSAAALPSSTQPLRVPLPAGALSIAASNQASFALLQDGSVWSWGGGYGFGTLGDGTAAGERRSPGPVQSTAGPLNGVLQLSVRDNDAIVLRSDGSVWTWGSFPSTATTAQPSGVVAGRTVATRMEGIPATSGGVRKVLTEQGLFGVLLAGKGSDGQDLDGAVYSWGVHFDITANEVLRDLVPARVLNLPPVRDLMPGGFLGYGQRPADRQTGMAIDYDGNLFKVRGRVAERYDPANPTAQRRPQGMAPRTDCASCHVVLPRDVPAVPTSGATCNIPAGIMALLTSASRCESCHNSAPLSNGRVLGALDCVPPTLPAPPPPTRATPNTALCALPAGHPVSRTGATCSSCHNTIVAAQLTCSTDLTPLQPPSTTQVTITQALDDVGTVQGPLAAGGTTDDTTPTLSGRLSAALTAGEYVTVLVDGVTSGQATVNGSAWTYSVPALAVGRTYQFTARVDRNGASTGPVGAPFSLSLSNQGPAKTVRIAQVVTNVAPARTITRSGETINDPSPTLSGAIDPALAAGESVELQRQDAAGRIVSLGVQAAGATWSFTDGSLVDGGRYTYRARAIGPTGAGAYGNEMLLIIDTTTPTTTPALTVTTDQPTSSLIAADRGQTLGLSDSTIALRARVTAAAAGDRIEFLVTDGQGRTLATSPASGAAPDLAATLTVPNGGQYTGTPTTPPTAAPLTLTIRARLVDAAGNAGPYTNSTHALGAFSCSELLAVKNANQPSAQHGGACTNCHFVSGSFQALPGRNNSPPPPPFGYWCSNDPRLTVPLR